MNTNSVAVLGPPGTYSHFAYQRLCTEAPFHFGAVLFQKSISDVFRSVVSGVSQYGIVPFRNTRSGLVDESITCFLHMDENDRVYVVGTLYVPITYFLWVNDSVKCLSDIEEVYSRQEAIIQCKKTLQGMGLSHYHYVESTASGFEIAKNTSRKAALGGTLGSEFGLRPIASGVEDVPGNTTAFYIIGKDEEVIVGEPESISLVFELENNVGALNRVTALCSSFFWNITYIQSLTTKSLHSLAFVFEATQESDLRFVLDKQTGYMVSGRLSMSDFIAMLRKVTSRLVVLGKGLRIYR